VAYLASEGQDMDCKLIGIPVQDGTTRSGCALAPDALRQAGLASRLEAFGRRVIDLGDVAAGELPILHHDNEAIHGLPQVAAWTAAIGEAAFEASFDGLPIFLGGDHSIAAGTLPGVARRAAAQGRPFFVLWLDAHPDFHTLDTTTSGNLHGVPLAYACGLPGFEGYFPKLRHAVDPSHVCLFGLRSVDPAENIALASSGAAAYGMHAVRQQGAARSIAGFLERVRQADGWLHVSLDADFLDPSVAPAVGTPVPGGVTATEALAVMAMLHASGVVASLDVAEFNPALDAASRTASVLVDLVACLVGGQAVEECKQAA
jgi:arginase